MEKDGALQASQVVPVGNNLPVNAGDTDLIPGLGKSLGEGNGNSLQYSCLENPTDGGRQSTESQRSDTTEHAHVHVCMGSTASASVSPTCWVMSHVCQASEGLLSPTRKSTSWCKGTRLVDFWSSSILSRAPQLTWPQLQMVYILCGWSGSGSHSALNIS